MNFSLAELRDEQFPTRSRPHCIKSADHFAQQCATKAALKHQPMPVKGLPSCSRQNTAAQDSIERASHPVHGGQSPIRPHNAEVGHKPMVHTQPTGQPRSAGNQSCTPHAVRARTAPRVLRPEAPGGSPRQWSFSSPGAHDGHPHRGPRIQGYHVQTKCPCTGLASSGLPAKLAPPPASADDGAAKAGPQAPGPGDVLPFKRPGHLPVDSGSPPCTGEGTLETSSSQSTHA